MGIKKTHRAVELLKSILIVALTLSGIWLVGRVQLYTELSFQSNWLGRLTSIFYQTTAAPDNSQTGQTTSDGGLRPVRVAISNEDGRYGIQYDAETMDAIFEAKLGSLLGEALASAGTAYEISEERWREALNAKQASVYYDFLDRVPLSALCTWLGGAENDVLTGEARRLLLVTGDTSTALLYYSGGEDGLYYACPTKVETDSRLKTVTEDYAPNNAIFAFQQEERYPNLEPYVMILPDTPALSVYAASNPISLQDSSDTLDTLLRGFSFQPQTSSVYQAADGQVVRERSDTLRISDTGVVTYHSSNSQNPRFSIDSDKDTPDRGEMVEAASAMVENALRAWCADADLFLMGTETLENESVAVYFGYLLDGAAVQLYEDGYAARVIITDGSISDFVIRFRAYQKTQTPLAILPEIQAVAAMNVLQPQGNELMLCYLDIGGTEVMADWVAK